MKRNFENVMELLKKQGINKDTRFFVNIENVEELFYRYFGIFLNGKEMVKAPEYKQVINWLENNEGKSLFLYGNNGRGKTIIATKVIPAIFLQFSNAFFTIVKAYDLADMYDGIKKFNFLVIDDLGTEPTETNNYGTKRSYINEIIDKVEDNFGIYIITSNLGKNEIIEKYGVRTFDRIVGNFKRVKFGGKNVVSGNDSFRR